jgi:hypothetical protein
MCSSSVTLRTCIQATVHTMHLHITTTIELKFDMCTAFTLLVAILVCQVALNELSPSALS